MTSTNVYTHYVQLEVAESASAETIRAAYRSLAQRWHPDRNQHRLDEAGDAMRRINQAYEVLSDPERRKQYDIGLAEQRRTAQSPHVGQHRDADNNSVRTIQAESVAKAGRVWVFLGCVIATLVLEGLLIRILGDVQAERFRFVLWVALVAFPWAGASYYVEHRKVTLLRLDDRMLQLMYEEQERKKAVRQTVGGVAVVVVVGIGMLLVARPGMIPTVDSGRTLSDPDRTDNASSIAIGDVLPGTRSAGQGSASVLLTALSRGTHQCNIDEPNATLRPCEVFEANGELFLDPGPPFVPGRIVEDGNELLVEFHAKSPADYCGHCDGPPSDVGRVILKDDTRCVPLLRTALAACLMEPLARVRFHHDGTRWVGTMVFAGPENTYTDLASGDRMLVGVRTRTDTVPVQMSN